MDHKPRELSASQIESLIEVLKARFEKNKQRHAGLNWDDVQSKLSANPVKLAILDEMEVTEGEPDVVAYDEQTNEFIFFDCAPESPKGRRSVCYDHQALESRKEHKPANSALGMAAEIGIEILTQEQYHYLQSLGKFDQKTSSWLLAPSDIRKLGGAIFGDFRYGRTFIYHNGAESYYAARGFRGSLRV